MMFLCLLFRKVSPLGLVILFFCLLPVKTGAEIFKYVDEKGVVHFSDAIIDMNDVDDVEVVREDTPSSDYEAIAEHYALKFGLEPSLVKKVIQVESNWNPYAVSRSGAMGLMQLMPETAKLLGVKDPFDPEENIRAGVRYLKYLLDLFDGDIERALAAYNAGPTVVIKHNGVPPINETIRYLKKIDIERFKTERKDMRVFKIILPDGTVLFTNSPVEGLREF